MKYIKIPDRPSISETEKWWIADNAWPYVHKFPLLDTNCWQEVGKWKGEALQWREEKKSVLCPYEHLTYPSKVKKATLTKTMKYSCHKSK